MLTIVGIVAQRDLFRAAVSSALDEAMIAATQRNTRAAEHVVAMKREINRLADSAALHEARRLVAEEPNRLPAYTVEMDILENLKRIFYFCKRIARGVVTSEGAGNPAGASAPPAS